MRVLIFSGSNDWKVTRLIETTTERKDLVLQQVKKFINQTGFILLVVISN